MKKQLQHHLMQALQECYRQGLLHSGTFPPLVLEEPANAGHGDLATNLALVLAREEKKAPRQVAEIVLGMLGDAGGLCRQVEIAGPGFINFFLSHRSWHLVLDEVARQGETYGTSAMGAGKRVQVEFVSANPTGPLHIGHGRGAATGDAVAAVLAAAGYEVQREYYINDAGNQVALLGRSIWLRWRELNGERIEFPEDGYRGDYIREIAGALDREHASHLAPLAEEPAVAFCTDFGVRQLLGQIDEDLQKFGIRFDCWYSERSLYDRGLVEKELAKLRQRGLTYEKDGALWLRTTDHGDDKDRVLLRADGPPTYFASDVAYHMEKFDRGFDLVVDVWGADHHGYVPRMKAMLAGLGRSPDDLQVLLIQMVNLLRDGQPVTMGKRSGEFITLREVVDEVGRDACRFFFLMRRSDSQLDFDLDLAKRQSNENPVYYVQYAHARICSISRNAAELGLQLPASGQFDLSPLELDEELALMKLLARYPETVEGAARLLEPHRIVFYLQELAGAFHSYYNRHRVLTEDARLSQARLCLVNGIRVVLGNALRLLGLSAPEQMQREG
ncbi:MAG: arginine--tRNA ligase [Desulfuromonadales bacterium]|nr:arginine--tRNA ligase [Desulfuromonadales bacterium]